MNAPSPRYYSSLRDFRPLFASGRPILTYHHVGPRPPGVRLKGLYLSPKLFQRQMAEFKTEGFRTDAFAAASSDQARTARVFLTFDDGFLDVFDHALPLLRTHGFSAIQFLVADQLGKTSQWQAVSGELPQPLMDEAQIRDWLASGHEIGSHTLSHPWLTRIPLSQAREEISASRKKLEDAFGKPIEHFCYPYGDWNPAIRDLVAEAGYRSACTTQFGVNNPGSDSYALNRITARYPSLKLKSLGPWLRFALGAR